MLTVLTKRISARSPATGGLHPWFWGLSSLAILQGVKLASSGMKEEELNLMGEDLSGHCFLLVQALFPFLSPNICALQLYLCPACIWGHQIPRLWKAPWCAHRMQDSLCKQPSQLLFVLLFMASNTLLQLFCTWEFVIGTNRAGDKKQAVLPFCFQEGLTLDVSLNLLSSCNVSVLINI